MHSIADAVFFEGGQHS